MNIGDINFKTQENMKVHLTLPLAITSAGLIK